MESIAMESISYGASDGVATLTLNRPAQRNALDPVMRSEIAEVMSAIRRDRGILALVITGAGGVFCAEGDIRSMQEGDTSAEAARNRMMDSHLWLEELLTLDRPVIAAGDGGAYGAGFALALASDFGQGIARTTDYHRAAVVRFLDKQPALFQWPPEVK